MADKKCKIVFGEKDDTDKERIIKCLQSLMPDGTCEWDAMRFDRMVSILESFGYVIIKREFRKEGVK